MKSILLGHDALDRAVELSAAERETHMHVIGSSGSGKSKFLEQMMRGDLDNRQGFCLIDPHGSLFEDVLNYCSHKVLNREIVLLNLSEPEQVIGFNPFKRAPHGDISVQVDGMIRAITRAWGMPNTDQTPTLERTLRLIFITLVELGLPFHAAQHMLNFESGEIRAEFVEKLSSPLIRQEWEELLALRSKDWRAEMLSAKNRLLRLLTSNTLARFFNTENGGIDLSEIIDNGKVLLVNLAPSASLSDENGRVFGALLLNAFFQAARRRRAQPGKTLVPYYLYLDEFQTFVTLDVASMLDQVRKYKVFAVLAHQRFGQLDEDLTDAVLTNCRIKAVFGGLPVEMARIMAQELFIGDLDPMRIKVAIYQTKFWPEYRRDRVYTKSGSRGRSLGRGENTTSGESAASVHGQFFEAQQWYSGDLVGTSLSSTAGMSSASGSHWNETDFEGVGEGEADVPILIPVPFQELSSVQYFTLEEQLTQLTAALKGQFGRHCFIKIHHQKTQPLRVPFVRAHYTPEQFIAEYQTRKFTAEGAQTAAVVDECIARQDEELRRSVARTAKDPEAKTKEPPPSWEDLLGRE
jgi:energy-coupling factor transporter ATP-binding protein EcfA2